MTEEFKQGDTVYTQDGTQYYFDHAAGDHGYVSPIIIIQTTNYHGDDYEEHEEVADHMIPLKLTSLSKTPWVRKIHEETKQAVDEQRAILNDIQGQIGAARTELRASEAQLEARGRELELQARALENRFQWVRDLRRMLSEDETRVLLVDDTVPYEITPSKIELRRDREDKNKWLFVSKYDYEEDERVQVFANENMMENGVYRLFMQRRGDMSLDDEIRWCKRWPKLPMSEAAQQKKAADEEEDRAKRLARAQEQLAKAQEEVDKWR